VPEEPTPPTPQDDKPNKLPMLLTMADITGWDIGPGKESDCQLSMKVAIKDFTNVQLIRALATGRVVLRILPLQMRLAPDAGSITEVDPEGCAHTGEKWDLGYINGTPMVCCMNCGLVLEVPKDDQPGLPEDPAPNGEDGSPPADETPPEGTDEAPPNE